jgi:hypothetical protein
MWQKYCTAGQATDGNIKRRMHLACRITNAIDTHWEYVSLMLSQDNSCNANAPQCDVLGILPLLFSFGPVMSLAEIADRLTIYVFVSINPLPFSLYNGLASNLPFDNSTDQKTKNNPHFVLHPDSVKTQFQGCDTSMTGPSHRRGDGW